MASRLKAFFDWLGYAGAILIEGIRGISPFGQPKATSKATHAAPPEPPTIKPPAVPDYPGDADHDPYGNRTWGFPNKRDER